MHGVRRTLVREQAQRTGLPLWEIPLPWPCANSDYEEAMRAVTRRAVQEGFQAFAFGDLFLEDIRAYRERQLAGTGLDPLFPVWGLPTRQLALDMIAAGVKCKLTCIDRSKLAPSFAGRDFDLSLVESLPPTADPVRGKRRVPHLCLRRPGVHAPDSRGSRRPGRARRVRFRRLASYCRLAGGTTPFMRAYTTHWP